MVGRTYRYYQGHPLYPFGYGLSYSSFMYKDLSVTPATVSATDSVTVMVSVMNSGQMASDEVSQAFITPLWLLVTC